MIIHRFHAWRFGCLDDCTVVFGPGLNVVCGPNESGKSTLQRALLTVLLDKPTRRKANEDARRWGAERLYRLEVEFETEGGCRWVLIKDYEENRVQMSGGDGATTDWEKIQDVLSGALGTCSPKILQSTCCVAQDELSAISEGKTDISRSLETMVTGGDDDACTSETITTLQKKMAAMRRGLGARGAANPGQLAALTERKRALEAQAAGYRLTLEQDELARQRLAEARDRLTQIESDLRPRLAARQAADRALGLTRELREWRDKESALAATLERIAGAEAGKAAATQALADLGLPPLSDASYQELTRLHERVALLRSQSTADAPSAGQPGRPPATPSARPTGAASTLGPVLLILLATGLGIGSVAAGLYARFPPLAIAAAAALSILLDVFGIVWLAFALRQRLAGGESTGLSAIPGTTDGRLEVQARLDLESGDLAARLGALGCADWATLEARHQRSRTLRAQHDDCQARLEGLLSPGQSVGDLEEARRAASLKRRELEETLNAPAYQRSLQLGAVGYQALCQEIDRLSAEQECLARDSIGLQARLNAARVTSEDLMVVEEQLAAASAELLRLEETLAVYELVLSTMQSARERTLVRAQDSLAPRAGAYLAELTEGRYSSTKVDSDLNVLVAEPQSPGGVVAPGRLSKGTQDQLYFALRLALIDLLFPGARPPLFLDDPFVKFDDARRQAALTLCQRIAQQRQVILFTCSSDYNRWGQVIRMPVTSPCSAK
jgi:uncharacterized protein YhaN